MQRFSSFNDGSNFTKISPSTIPAFSSFSQKLENDSIGFNSMSSGSFTPSPSPSSYIEETSSIATENRLYLARLNLEYQQLISRYGLCLNHLQEAVKESENLRNENERLRIANKDLMKRLTLLTQVSLRNRFLSQGFPSLSIINDFRNLLVRDNGSNHVSSAHEVSDNNNTTSPTSVIENNRFDKKTTGERVTLPKSISIRSSGYLKSNPSTTASASAGAGGSTSASTRTNRFRSASPVKNHESQRVFVPGGNKEEESVEFDVYNQGMFKTELCNKWQETGACPYGDHCQFAHGIDELRPIIRHPRYKTEVCRMVLAGDPCPYGHRCHFRHALTEQEKSIGGC